MQRIKQIIFSFFVFASMVACQPEAEQSITPRFGSTDLTVTQDPFVNQNYFNGVDYSCTVTSCPKINVNIEFINGLIDETTKALNVYQGNTSIWQFKAVPQEDLRLVSLFVIDNVDTQDEFINLLDQSFSGEMIVTHNGLSSSAGTLKIIARDMTKCARDNNGDRSSCLDFSKTDFREYDTILPYPYLVLDNPIDEFEKQQKEEKSKKFWNTVLNIGQLLFKK